MHLPRPAVAVAAFAAGGTLALLVPAAGAVFDDGSAAPVPAAVVQGSTDSSSTSPDDLDISGPCDEAEHANDPQCTGVPAPPGAVDDDDDDGVDDISGPCDEAEHANDPQCTGVPAPPGAVDDDDDGVDDISGPCDEAEHANDPRCTGAAPVDDNSGPGSSHDAADDNSGPGNGDEVDGDHSGHGGGDDDNSGSGSGSG